MTQRIPPIRPPRGPRKLNWDLLAALAFSLACWGAAGAGCAYMMGWGR